MSYTVTQIDYTNPQQAEAMVALLSQYACDDMGGGEDLPAHVKHTLAAKLAERRDAISLIAYAGDTPIGLLNAFEGFSSFAAAPLLNIHDAFVAPAHRGKGALNALFDALETIARQRDCCKITLEVLSNNQRAKAAYQNNGFQAYALADGAGYAEFWQKKLG